MRKTKSTPLPKNPFIIVTTAHKGVFAGHGNPSSEKTIRLTDAQMCVYWPSSTHGVLGLATKGPQDGSRIGPPVPAITLQDITSIIEVTSEAEANWKKQPWN